MKKHWLEKVFASRFRKVKKPCKTNGKTRFQMSEFQVKKAYKTNGILALFGPKSEKGLQNHWKSSTYRSFLHRVFAKPKYLIKQMENPLCGKWISRCEKACKTNGILPVLGQNPKKGSKIIEKALPTEAFCNAFPQSHNTL